MKLHFAKLIFLLGSLFLSLGVGHSAETHNKLILVTGADPQHPYLKKQIQFLAEVLKTLDYELEVQMHQSAVCFELSNSGQVDGEIWRILGVDAEYQNLLRVPTAIWSHPELAFVKGAIVVDGWESLAPYRVAYRAGTKVVENNIKGIVKDQVALNTVDEAFQQLVQGKVDVVISDSIVGTLLLASDRYRESGIRLIEKPLDTALLFTYLHMKHAELVPRLAAAIRLAKHDGTYQRIVGEAPGRD